MLRQYLRFVLMLTTFTALSSPPLPFLLPFSSLYAAEFCHDLTSTLWKKGLFALPEMLVNQDDLTTGSNQKKKTFFTTQAATENFSADLESELTGIQDGTTDLTAANPVCVPLSSDEYFQQTTQSGFLDRMLLPSEILESELIGPIGGLCKDELEAEEPSLENNAQFFKMLSDHFFQDDAFQKINPEDFENLVLDNFEEAVNADQDDRNRRYEKNKTRATELRKWIVNKTIQGLIDGPFVTIGKIGVKVAVFAYDKASSLVFSSDQQAEKGNKPHEVSSIALRSLIPASRYKMMATKIGHGAGMILLGAGGITLTFLAGPYVSLSCSLPGAAFDVGMTMLENKLNRDPTRKHALAQILRDRKLNYGDDEKIVMATVADTVVSYPPAIAVQETIYNSTNAAIRGTANVTLQTLGTIGSGYQVVKGFKKIYEAFAGTEKGYNTLLKYEHAYQEILEQQLQAKQAYVRAALKQAQRGVSEQISSGETFDLATQVNCLCQADHWLKKTKKKADQRFKARLKYLAGKSKGHEKKIQKESLANEKDLAKKIAAMKLRKQEMKKETKELLSIYKELGGRSKKWKKQRAVERSDKLIPTTVSDQATDLGAEYAQLQDRLNQEECDQSTLLQMISQQMAEQGIQDEKGVPVFQDTQGELQIFDAGFVPSEVTYLKEGMVRLRHQREDKDYKKFKKRKEKGIQEVKSLYALSQQKKKEKEEEEDEDNEGDESQQQINDKDFIP